MPVEWQTKFDEAPALHGAFSSARPLARVRARPHQSMTAEGFVGFMAATFAMVAVPLLAVLGSPVLWGVLPFVVLALWALWTALKRNQKDAQISETLTIWNDDVELVRRDPGAPERRWQANPHWVQVEMHKSGGPVENYLTLRGGGRTVEIGAFLSPEERVTLHADLTEAIASIRSA